MTVAELQAAFLGDGPILVLEEHVVGEHVRSTWQQKQQGELTYWFAVAGTDEQILAWGFSPQVAIRDSAARDALSSSSARRAS